ncbi:tail protein [Elizabethkingia phage TCUEAP3]|nr:tail protein [Elizabethkingia phage TCUEAP3]
METTTNTERTIISDNRQIIARAIISGNTVTFNYNYIVNPQKPPFVITFSVQRGKTGDQDFTGNFAMTGSYFPENDKFQFEATGSKPGDETLREGILNECKVIIAELTV